MSKQAEYVLRTVEERGIRFVRLWFTDVQGFLKSVSISPTELEVAFEEGMTFDGSSIDGYARVQEADMLAQPDPSTFAVLPWRSEQQVARMFCDIYTPDGEPFSGDPRIVLKRNLDRASEMGYTFYAAPELEFFYFEDDGPNPQVLDRGGYFDLTPLDVAQEYRRKTINALEQLGIPIEHSHHEVAPSQHEIIARYTDALTMADNIMTSRLTVKEVALQSGIYATFMPKPLEDYDGSGMHLHISLFEGDVNAFHEPGTQGGLSKVGQAFIAGLLRHASELTAVTNQWVNSYKRLVAGFDAPIYISWARNNQSSLVRVPSVKKGKPSSVRVEYRAADAACNPYLALSVILAAGLAGIREGYELPPEVAADVKRLTAAERAAAGAKRLPETLSEALDLLEQSDLVAEALGEHVFDWFLRNKRAEWERYQHHVSHFELDTYLPIL
ncbi:MAG: type I glutamate--ammonia ligase [Actinobacteria bacterium]|nr:type I glutamate--ammonia ligase [Actinomycetota bacterium]MCZ6567217.1 type I glutamate--ammonia ligase [Actinomycetota bacterium]MCZ6630264.1 type I glutamate--ammonia ligase [Actinomycetota bacterium]